MVAAAVLADAELRVAREEDEDADAFQRSPFVARLVAGMMDWMEWVRGCGV